MDLNEKQSHINELEKCKTALKKAVKERDELKSQLDETSKKLAYSESFKSHFIARISNEIINPFTAIIASSESLLKRPSLDENHDVKHMVELIHTEALFLDFQLKNLFTAARIEAGELVPETVNIQLNTLMEESVKGFSEEADNKDILLKLENKVPEEARLKTDPSLLVLVMKNLLSNAIKFSKRNAMVNISAAVENRAFVFSVENKGDKIPADKLEAIFDRFRQLDTKIHSLNPGSGIGLSVAREVLELLNGSIDVQAVEDGMRFCFRVKDSRFTDHIVQDDENLFFDEEEQEGQSF